ncbi:hypothetical protein [Candidatus Enterococcus willemsii]|uniref:LXG domain-containing protein n=1 Tax=Candidatus Enterococcus willemsii TaxID=1857215 RepID=A0ABQ6Z271_9ENTE|nr:hypothetical protein [Enterococcus sp. CU12B]KAF1305705.1 hypothetical protein BAU17_00200 [Enterococcus sp. CU12B]
MTINQYVQELANSQASLIHLQEGLLANQALMKQETAQEFIFDLRDYADSLAIVTDFVDEPVVDSKDAAELSAILGEQNQLLHAIIQDISQTETFFNQKGGELRRTLASLQGVLELNGLLLQDNRAFQQILKQTGEQMVEKPIEKSSFFQRLFGKK